MELNKLYNMDCLIGMQEIPSGSVDLIICDPPYGTMKGAAVEGWVLHFTSKPANASMRSNAN